MKRRENLKIPTSSPQTVNKHIILIYITKYTVNMKKLQKKREGFEEITKGRKDRENKE